MKPDGYQPDVVSSCGTSIHTLQGMMFYTKSLLFHQNPHTTIQILFSFEEQPKPLKIHWVQSGPVLEGNFPQTHLEGVGGWAGLGPDSSSISLDPRKLSLLTKHMSPQMWAVPHRDAQISLDKSSLVTRRHRTPLAWCSMSSYTQFLGKAGWVGSEMPSLHVCWYLLGSDHMVTTAL